MGTSSSAKRKYLKKNNQATAVRTKALECNVVPPRVNYTQTPNMYTQSASRTSFAVGATGRMTPSSNKKVKPVPTHGGLKSYKSIKILKEPSGNDSISNGVKIL